MVSELLYYYWDLREFVDMTGGNLRFYYDFSVIHKFPKSLVYSEDFESVRFLYLYSISNKTDGESLRIIELKSKIIPLKTEEVLWRYQPLKNLKKLAFPPF